MPHCQGRTTKEETRNYLIAEAAATKQAVCQWGLVAGDPRKKVVEVCPLCNGAGLYRGNHCNTCASRGIV